MKILTFSPKETEEIGSLVAEDILYGKAPRFVAMRGDLGSGKTTFMKGFARSLGIKDNISSPTFTIFKKYKTEKGFFFYHFDAYRIADKEELIVLGFSDIVSDNDNVLAVEWSENVEDLLPKKRVDISFSFIGEEERELIIEGISGRIGSVKFKPKSI